MPPAANWRRPGFVLLNAGTCALLGLVVLPFAVVTLGAFLPASFLGVSTEQWAAGGGNGSGDGGFFTGRWFAYVWNLYRGPLAFSFGLAVACSAGCLLVGVPAGYALAGRRFPGRGLVEAVALLPLSVPGIALSVALIGAFGRVRGSPWLLLAGHGLYTLPFMVSVIAGSLRGFDLARLEDAARSLGANGWQRFAWVVLPNVRHAAMLGSLLVFAVSWGEFNISFLLNTPTNQTFPAALYATYTSNSFPVSSAATVIFLAVVLPVFLLIEWLGGRRGAGARIEQGG